MTYSLRHVQAYEVDGRSPAMSANFDAIARSEGAGLPPEQINAALTQVNWGPNGGAA